MVPSIEYYVAQLKVESQEKQMTGRVLERLHTAIAEVGYDNFVEDVTSGEFLGGPDSAVGARGISVIPSHTRGDSCTILVAVSKGEKRAAGFPSIMKQVREKLIRGIHKTRVVIVLCDYWRPDMLDEHIGDLRAHHDRGIRFLFLLVGTPGHVVSPVAVDLGVGP